MESDSCQWGCQWGQTPLILSTMMATKTSRKQHQGSVLNIIYQWGHIYQWGQTPLIAMMPRTARFSIMQSMPPDTGASHWPRD